MLTQSLHRSRPIVLGVALLAFLVLAIPLIVNAQDATPGASPAPDQVTRGEEIFNNVCIACHQPDGKGIEGIYLPLADNPALLQEDPTYLITVILNGRGGMPTFANTYDDEEVAAIATYVRQAWDNDASPVTAEQVAAVRAQYTVPPQTPEGQLPNGSGLVASPEASPAATPGN